MGLMSRFRRTRDKKTNGIACSLRSRPPLLLDHGMLLLALHGGTDASRPHTPKCDKFGTAIFFGETRRSRLRPIVPTTAEMASPILPTTAEMVGASTVLPSPSNVPPWPQSPTTSGAVSSLAAVEIDWVVALMVFLASLAGWIALCGLLTGLCRRGEQCYTQQIDPEPGGELETEFDEVRYQISRAMLVDATSADAIDPEYESARDIILESRRKGAAAAEVAAAVGHVERDEEQSGAPAAAPPGQPQPSRLDLVVEYLFHVPAPRPEPPALPAPAPPPAPSPPAVDKRKPLPPSPTLPAPPPAMAAALPMEQRGSPSFPKRLDNRRLVREELDNLEREGRRRASPSRIRSVAL